MKYMSEAAAREAICEIGRRLHQNGLVAANDGNISVRIGENQLICTPSGISKGFMKEAELVKIDLCGNPIDSINPFGLDNPFSQENSPHQANFSVSGKPTSEIKLHLKVYEKNPEMTAVIHAHPKTATAFAVAGLSLEEPIMTESLVVLGPIPLAPYAEAGTDAAAQSISELCCKYKGALLANHGAVTWGEDLTSAWVLMESLEHSAEILMRARYILGNVNLL